MIQSSITVSFFENNPIIGSIANDASFFKGNNHVRNYDWRKLMCTMKRTVFLISQPAAFEPIFHHLRQRSLYGTI